MNKNTLLIGAVLIIILSIYYLNGPQSRLFGSSVELGADEDVPRVREKSSQYEPAKELVGISGYLNSENFTLAEHIGKKVILLDFWTYTCINCQRTLPYLIAWDKKYRDQGLLIVGVHTPEFEFEKKRENVQQAIEEFDIEYPVVQDNDYATWRAYQNQYWPRKYLIDIDGFIRYDHIGEGGYEETEQKIQELLKERAEILDEDMEISTEISSVAAETSRARSPETYFGAWRNTNLGNGVPGQSGIQNLTLAHRVIPNTLYLSGEWDIQQQFARTTKSDGRIFFQYGAQKVFLVARADRAVKLNILIDGKAPGNLSGKDVVEGSVTVQEDRLYRLIESDGYNQHVLEIIVEDPSLEAYAFTFG
jgi:thiol-disulfide isomerase/thioredoxin